MLPQAFRLKRSGLFQKTLASGKVLCQNPRFLVLGLKRVYESPTPTRFGFIVSRKISNRANVRNKVKRRLRELVRALIKTPWMEPLAPYIAVVVIARQGICDTSYGELHALLLQCLKRR